MAFAELLGEDENHVIFKGSLLEVFIPKDFFVSGLAEQVGSHYNIYGFLACKIYNNDKLVGKHTMNISTFNTFYPNIIEEVKTSIMGEDEDEYFVMKFYKGDRIMNKFIPKNTNNVELFLKIICSGKLPRTIPYSELMKIWDSNLELNQMKFKVSSVVREIILSHMIRSIKDEKIRFSQVKGKNPSISDFDYKPLSINNICALSGTFSAISFENLDEMMIIAINNKQYEREEKDTPLEKLIKM